MTAKQKIIVTGGAGYIGSVLVGRLLDEGYTVKVIDRLFFGESSLAHLITNPNLSLIRKDVRDVSESDLKGFDIVCDLAALSNDPSGDINPDLTYSINHKGRVHVANTAKKAGISKYILASSCSVYGAGQDDRLSEISAINPLTAYAKSNALAEEDLFKLKDDNFSVTALRNATVFGLSTRMRFDLIINIMTLHAFEKGRIIVLGGGQQWRPLVHVSDVALAFLKVIEAPKEKVNGEVFNVGFDNLKVRTVASIIRETLPFKIDIELAPDDADKRNYNVSFDKIKNTLGYNPQKTIEDGINEIYEALKYGQLENAPQCVTVKWYQHILNAQKLIDSVYLDGRLI